MTMNVTRKEAIKTLRELWRETNNPWYEEVYNMAIEALSAEAVHGEWKIDEYGIYHCPICHAINNTVYKSYCPNCGAKMEGREP